MADYHLLTKAMRESGVFDEVTLRTARAEFVGKTMLPRFTPPPLVLIWGNRVFVRRLPPKGNAQADPEYVEAFGYVIVNPVGGDDD